VNGGAPVVLVHGLTASMGWWRPTIAALEPRHDVQVVELPGLPVRDAALRLAAWLEERELRGAALVGHSMGGTIAVLTAAEAPDLVGRLALIAPAGVFRSRSRRSYIVPIAYSAVVRAPTQVPRMIRDALRIGPLRLWRISADLLLTDVVPALRSVRAPTLVLWGANDRVLSPSLSEIFRSEIPDCRLVMLPNCGHVPMVECPDDLHRHLLGFLT
jgi:pimeloyl-ACP methyl ester carboxylesterase